jgi:hypothetical protein
VLAGVHDAVLVRGPVHRGRDRSELDQLGPGADDTQDLHVHISSIPGGTAPDDLTNAGPVRFPVAERAPQTEIEVRT